MGVLAVLRSRYLKNNRAVGVMITASHNPECDNGIKLVDGDGGMLNQSWEPYAERLANATDFVAAVTELEQELGLTTTATAAGEGERGVVYVGRDTRPHSAELSECVKEGVEAYGGVVVDLGQVTTPQLHFAVKEQDHGEYRESRYFETLSAGYLALRDGAGSSGSDCVVVDGANGIGALAIVRMGEVIGRENLLLDVRNAVGDGPVNEGCGAEIVQKGQVPPCGVDASSDANKLLCSLDGDADRIVFHSFLGACAGACVGSDSDRAENKWILLDGDKIGCLMAVVLKQELVAAQLEGIFSLGVVQTAYANGASGAYLRSQGVPIAMAKTGVKYLHHVAHQFDVGVYFEANGHGTVLFSEAFLAYLKENNGRSGDTSDRIALALRRLDAFTKAINQAVGDAISDMLVVLACLRILDMNLLAWHAMYTDLPSKQLKIPVSNKSLITCTEDETAALTPPSLPIALQEAMSTTPLGRCFVRPSGTEDVVRVYAEAETQEAADALAAAAVAAVHTSLSSSVEPILSRQHTV